MWDTVVGWFKSFFGGKGTSQIGKGNRAVTGSTTGDNSPVVTAGRDVHFNMQHSSLNPAPKTRSQELVEWIRQNGAELPLSQVLPRALELAQRVEDRNLERWIRLELYGHNLEGEMTQQDEIPEYRQVTGRHYSEGGQYLDIDDPELRFVNTYRLRYGVGTLEEFAKKTDTIHLADFDMAHLIRKHLDVDVSRFCFSPLEIVTVLNTIRNRLLEKVNRLDV